MFLLFGTVAEAPEIMADVAGVFGGAPLVFLVALLAFLAFVAVGSRRKRLAIGAAFATGSAALGPSW